jgi:hypothetical protein
VFFWVRDFMKSNHISQPFSTPFDKPSSIRSMLMAWWTR